MCMYVYMGNERKTKEKERARETVREKGEGYILLALV